LIEVQNKHFFLEAIKRYLNGLRNIRIDEKLANLSSAERKILEPVLITYAGIFHNNEDNDFKSTNVLVHKIETGDATPIKRHLIKPHLL
jgi:hypothetical protein